MPRVRSVRARERDQRAVDLRRAGFAYQVIASQLGLRTKSAAYAAVQRGLADNGREASDEVRQLELERLDALAVRLQQVLSRPHFAFTQSGRVITDPESGERLLDDGPVVAAVGQLLRVSESRRRLLGLDAPVRSRVEVVTAEMVEDEIGRMERLVAESRRAVGQVAPVVRLKALPAGETAVPEG